MIQAALKNNALDPYTGVYEIFEEELVDELKSCPLMAFKKGDYVQLQHFCIERIPMLISGSLKLITTNLEGQEKRLGSMKPVSCCIYTMLGAPHKALSTGSAIATTETQAIMIPPEKLGEWEERYPKWRLFVHGLYQDQLYKIGGMLANLEQKDERIKELESQVEENGKMVKGLQDAVFSHSAMRLECLPESFLLYTPREHVSSDFYWGLRSGNKILFGVADCTGTGTTGGMVSVFFNKALECLVGQDNITDPGRILNAMNERLISLFVSRKNQFEERMALGLCSYDPKSGALQYAGANLPLYQLAHTTNAQSEAQSKLIKHDAHRHQLGDALPETDFRTTAIDVKKGDVIYLCTDGFANQLGGDRHKRYKSKQLKKTLTEIQSLSMVEQKIALSQRHDEWKGRGEQTDDITILGVKF